MNTHRKLHRYPWDQWFASGGFEAVRNVSFWGRTDSFIQLIRQRCIGRDFRASIQVSDDGDTVRCLLVPKDRNAARCWPELPVEQSTPADDDFAGLFAEAP